MKTYIRKGDCFVALPDRKDYVGKWFIIDNNKLKISAEKPKNASGFCVDLVVDEEKVYAIMITDVIGPTSFIEAKRFSNTSIQQLITWKNEIRTYMKNFIDKHFYVKIYSNTNINLDKPSSDGPYQYYLSLNSDSCNVYSDFANYDDLVYAIKTTKFIIK